jgi:hypothetical protein
MDFKWHSRGSIILPLTHVRMRAADRAITSFQKGVFLRTANKKVSRCGLVLAPHPPRVHALSQSNKMHMAVRDDGLFDAFASGVRDAFDVEDGQRHAR